MVLRVDVVAAALDAVYGGVARPPRDRADAAGPPARPGASSRSSPPRSALTLLSVALRGLRRADRHAPLLGRDLDRPVRPLRRRAAGDGALDAIARLLPGALAEGSGERESSRPSSRAGSSTRTTRGPAEFRGWTVPDVLLSGDHGRIEEWRREQSRERSADRWGVVSDFERYGWEPDGSRRSDDAAGAGPDRGERLDRPCARAGLVAAIAAAWVGLISKYTSTRSGRRLGIGFRRLAVERAGRAPRPQAIAVVTALLGVLLGKYLGFAFASRTQLDATGCSRRDVQLFRDTWRGLRPLRPALDALAVARLDALRPSDRRRAGAPTRRAESPEPS